MSALHPDLALGRFAPSVPTARWAIMLMQKLKQSPPRTPDDILIETVSVPGHRSSPGTTVRVYRPVELVEPAPALFWIHGGGFIGGSPIQDEARCISIARTLGITVVSVSYRLAPHATAPAALDDSYAGLSWLYRTAAERGIDPSRVAIGGASAGAGLAASLVQYTHDVGEWHPIFQLLVYPMLDDRTVLRDDLDRIETHVWKPANNRIGWSWYLGVEPGSAEIPEYAAPARRENLEGLPPAWIGVGTLDLFHDEDVDYARRLTEAGVPCDLYIVPGAFHGFDQLFAKKPITLAFFDRQDAALRAALFPQP